MSRIASSHQELTTLAQQAMQAGKNSGIDEIKLVASTQIDQRLVIEGDEYTLAQSGQSRGIVTVVHQKYRKGSVSGNHTSGQDIRDAIQQAAQIAQFTPEDTALYFPGPQEAKTQKPLKQLYDGTIEDLDLKDIAPLMEEALAELTKDPRLALERFEIETDVAHTTLLNSHGVQQSEPQTTVQWNYMGMLRDGDDVSGMDYDGGFSFSWAETPEKLLADVREFRERILKHARVAPESPTYKGPIILSPRACEELLLEVILYHISGWQVIDGKSRWEHQIQHQIVDQKLSLFDDPHNLALLGACSYDDEGLPTQKLPLITKGVLDHLLFDTYTARKLNKPTMPVSGGPFGLQIAAGTTPHDQLLNLVPKILYVDRFSGNVDELTGDFSGVAKSSHYYQHGEDHGVVTETMIAGNVFAILNNIVAIGDRLSNISGQFIAPTMIVDGVSVTGGG